MEHLRPTCLSQIAALSGFGVSDVALLAELDESTVSRLWDMPDWLDRIRGRSLQALIAAVPGVAEYATTYPLRTRQARLVHDLHREGLAVDEAALVSLSVPAPYVANALEAALQVVRGDIARAMEYLPRFWGREQDRALDVLFSPAGGLLVDARPLLEAAGSLAPLLTRSAYSFNAILAQAHLTHHVAKATGVLPEQLAGAAMDRRGAFTLRSTVMGALGQSDDRDLADRYRHLVDKHPPLRLVEEWAFPTWMRDSRPTLDFSLPPSLLLRRTAGEILRELGQYGDAYCYYLVTTYVPLALDRDPTFGLRAGELRVALLERREMVNDSIIRRAMDTLARQIPTGAS
ncbi:hypothetical protein [Frankia sp. Cas3]|uniref:hypothetical protein n=1 Tax=Frankia sp. Cas3 TaxID=3073926 RepID=UPI002AD3A5B6|nr:hypothetical protein [Frankia sp. Cas3]